MDIPKHIDTDGIHPEGLANLDAMLPIRLWNTGIMNLCGFHHEGFAIQQETLVAYREMTCLNQRRRHQQ